MQGLASCFWALGKAKIPMGFPRGSDSKDSACNTGDLDLNPRWEDLETGMATHSCSCFANSMGRGAWQAIIHRVAKSQTWLSEEHPPTQCPDNPEDCVGRGPGTESVAVILEDTRGCHRAGDASGMGLWTPRTRRLQAPASPQSKGGLLAVQDENSCFTSVDVLILPPTCICPSAFLLRALLNIFKTLSFLSSAGGWRKGTSVHALTSAGKGNWLPEDKMAVASDGKNKWKVGCRVPFRVWE